MTTTVEDRFVIGFAPDGSIALAVMPGCGRDVWLPVLELLLRQYPNRPIVVRSVTQEDA